MWQDRGAPDPHPAAGEAFGSILLHKHLSHPQPLKQWALASSGPRTVQQERRPGRRLAQTRKGLGAVWAGLGIGFKFPECGMGGGGQDLWAL